MAEPTNEKTECPHCDGPFYPRWKSTGFTADDAARDTTHNIGRVWATTCTSCDRPVVKLSFVEPYSELMSDWDHQTVAPVEAEAAIEFIVNILVTLHVRSMEEKGETVSDDDKAKARDWFRDMWSAAYKASKAGKVVGTIAELGEDLIELLPSLPPS